MSNRSQNCWIDWNSAIVFDTLPVRNLLTSKNIQWRHISNIWVCTFLYGEFLVYSWISVIFNQNDVELDFLTNEKFLYGMYTPIYCWHSNFALKEYQIKWQLFVFILIGKGTLYKTETGPLSLFCKLQHIGPSKQLQCRTKPRWLLNSETLSLIGIVSEINYGNWVLGTEIS